MPSWDPPQGPFKSPLAHWVKQDTPESPQVVFAPVQSCSFLPELLFFKMNSLTGTILCCFFYLPFKIVKISPFFYPGYIITLKTSFLPELLEAGPGFEPGKENLHSSTFISWLPRPAVFVPLKHIVVQSLLIGSLERGLIKNSLI